MAYQTFTQLIKAGGNANGNYPSNAGVDYPGPAGFLSMAGTFAGASFSVQTLPDGMTTWIDMASSTLTSAGSVLIRLGMGEKFRLVETGAAAGTVVDAVYAPYTGGV